MYPEGEHIDLAIQAVGESKLENLAQKLTDYLMGDGDDSPKVCKHELTISALVLYMLVVEVIRMRG